MSNQTETPETPETQQVQEAEPTPTPNKRQRRSKSDAAPKKLYFHEGTQAAIVLYQQTSSSRDRERIYVQDIMPAFEKLVENLINIHKFKAMHDSYEDLKNDCVNFLFETIIKFDADRGTNAFSYFNVVAKNWLIIRTKQRLNRVRRSISLDDPDALNAYEAKIIDEHCTVTSQDEMLEKQFMAQSVIEMLYEIREKSRTENELLCINSIITIFENIDKLDLLNKSAILLYLRELSGLTPKQLTTTMQSIKRHYRRMKSDAKFTIFE